MLGWVFWDVLFLCEFHLVLSNHPWMKTSFIVCIQLLIISKRIEYHELFSDILQGLNRNNHPLRILPLLKTEICKYHIFANELYPSCIPWSLQPVEVSDAHTCSGQENSNLFLYNCILLLALSMLFHKHVTWSSLDWSNIWYLSQVDI